MFALDVRMMQRWSGALMVVAVFVVLCLAPEEALAGPGGVFVKGIASTKIGKVVLTLVALIFFPLLIWVFAGIWLGRRRTRRDLKVMAAMDPAFEWRSIHERLTLIVQSVSDAWRDDDLARVAPMLTAAYYEEQKDLLARWAAEGKSNVFTLEKLRSIRPLHFSAQFGPNHSTLTVTVVADAMDFLMDLGSGKVLRGKDRQEKNHETIWRFRFLDGDWLLDAIEPGDMELAIARLPRVIERSGSPEMVDGFDSEFSTPDLATEVRADQEERADVQVSSDEEHRRAEGDPP